MIDDTLRVNKRRSGMKSYQEQTRSSTSCAACKFLKRRCTPNCQFAPYFHSDEPKKFAKVHKVFGASNVSKILNEVAEDQREDTVNSLVYEAEVRLRDPVYGCIGAIASLQHRMAELQHDLILARARLASYVGHRPSFLDDHGGLLVAPSIDFPESNSLPFDQFGRFHFP
ncbi:LOB domain-containing protein 21 [Sesamum angolense]|uniref:LOB domain-containing protein 21 n=1 Tax=Sesamum angolense TaxID=2727404 RepID=A0AAE1X1H4_9LAMI|nr:LOB domain-containing protein 21 [Sesamum angolense]